MKTSTSRTTGGLDRASADTWHATAPRALVRAYSDLGDPDGWVVLADHLETRRDVPSSARVFGDRGPALLWGMPDALVGTETAELVAKLGNSKSFEKPRKRRRWAEVVANWLDAASVASASVAHAYECLAWTHALPQLPNCIEEDLWWKLVNHLATIAGEADQLAADRDPLLWQLLGELQGTLVAVLPELSVCHELAVTAKGTISAGIQELLDDDGIPARPLMATFPTLVASWTRSRIIAERSRGKRWPAQAIRSYELGLLSLARLGTLDSQLCRAGLKLDLEKSTRRLLGMLAEGKSGGDQRSGDKSIPLPAMHSEPARLAVLRPTWAAKSPRLSVTYDGRAVQLELRLSGKPILAGEWQLDIALNDRSRQVVSDWEHVCWYSDKDVDFLEIEASLGEGLRVQRQILLAREDDVLLLADTVLSSESGRIEYRSSIPLGSRVSFEAAEETREGILLGRSTRALVLPLALPEWRSDQRRGKLESVEGRLVLIQSHEGRAAYAPLLIDLNAGRAKQECTWRQLTVAEWRQPQPGDVAVGFRGQVGKVNWLVYRSLSGEGIRSLLGQQVKAEFLFGRMKPGGDCARLLEIEPIDD